MKNLLDILNNFHNKKILVVGDVILDKYTIGHVKRISPEAPVPVVNVEEEFYKPGGAANVALNAANLSLKGEIYLFSFVGDDFYGNELRKILVSNNIDCYFEKSDSTIIKERVIGRSSGQQQHIVRIDREAVSEKFFKDINSLLRTAEKADKIIISDYAKGTITEELVNNLSQYKQKIIVDPKPGNKNFKTIYKNSFMITPSRDEALKMSGCYEIDEAGYNLRREFNSNILVTLGKDGMKLFPLNNTIINLETIPEESFEETGAGDTVIVAIALALSSSNDSLDSLINAAKIGNLAAGITIKHIGTYAPSFKELEEKILSLRK